MSNHALCYVAAPFSDASPTIRAWHVARAVLLARLAMACGLAPVEPHTSIAAGVYGDDSNPEQRARGMVATRQIAALVMSGGGKMWALLRDDYSMSDGVRDEVQIADDRGISRARRAPWAEWRTIAAQSAPHLLPAWDRLAVRPDAGHRASAHAALRAAGVMP